MTGGSAFEDSSEAARPDIRARIEPAIKRGYEAFADRDNWNARANFDFAVRDVRVTGYLTERLPELIGMWGRSLQRDKRLSEAIQRYQEAASEAERQGLGAQQLRWLGRAATVQFTTARAAQ